MITKQEIERFKVLEFSERFSEEIGDNIANYLNSNLRTKDAKRIYFIVVSLYGSFIKHDKAILFSISQLNNSYYLSLSTLLPIDVALFIKRCINRINRLSVLERILIYTHLLWRDGHTLSTKWTLKQKIVWACFDSSRKITERIIINQSNFDNKLSKIEITVPVNINRHWEYRLNMLFLNYSPNSIGKLYKKKSFNSYVRQKLEIINEISLWHKENNYIYSNIMDVVITKLKKDKLLSDTEKFKLLISKSFLDKISNNEL